MPKKIRWKYEHKPDRNLKTVVLYTDGGCWPNPGGRGGWAFLLQDEKGNVLERCGPIAAPTTNNRAEMMAMLYGLKALKEPCNVTIITDSMLNIYTLNFLNACKAQVPKYGKGLIKRKNLDLIERLRTVILKHNFQGVWVRGHNGDVCNERCDELALMACKTDKGHEFRSKKNMPQAAR